MGKRSVLTRVCRASAQSQRVDFEQEISMYYAIKVVISAALIVVISEVSKRYSLIGGILASLPIVSVLALVWLYYDTNDFE